MTKGETLNLSVTAGDAATVEFRFGGASLRSVAATSTGDAWSISESTAAWDAGEYAWQAWATLSNSSVRVIASGAFTLDSPLAVGDVRTTAQRVVEMIEAMIQGNAGEGVKRYKINNRELERYSVPELLQLLSYWRQRAAVERRRKNGLSSLGPRIEIRF
jgi:hypothetical protein